MIDEWQFNNSDNLNANFVCYGEWEIMDNSAKAMVDGTKVEISFENGNDLSLEIDNTMTDYANRFVSVLRVKTGRTNFSKLISKIKYFDGDVLDQEYSC